VSGTEIAYLDESYDERAFVMSALVIPVHLWRDGFLRLKAYRKDLKDRHGIFTSKELHATEFVAGRGRIAPEPVPKGLRAFLFRQTVRVIASLPEAAVISGCWPRAGATLNEVHCKAFSRIQERLQTRAVRRDGHMLMVVDEGKEEELRRIARRSKEWNPVGSSYGSWEDGSSYKNIPNDRLIEDPIFKRSDQSYFLQAVDFVAFSLLKGEVPPTPRIVKYGLTNVYEELEPILAKEASRKDPRGLGIVRT
jgi:hypothetical protein